MVREALSLLAAAAAATVPSPTLAPHSTIYSTAAPPERFRGDAALNDVRFVHFEEMAKPELCGDPPKPGDTYNGCRRGNMVVLPNPCLFADREEFARLACHEIGHVNGWPSTHGD